MKNFLIEAGIFFVLAYNTNIGWWLLLVAFYGIFASRVGVKKGYQAGVSQTLNWAEHEGLLSKADVLKRIKP